MSAASVYAALGLSRNPFPPTPDAGSYFFTSQLEEEFTEIAHCIQAHKGFVLLTGEVGLGKSTMVRRLLDTLPSEGCHSALILNTFLQGEALLATILGDFGLTPQPGLEAGLAQLNAFLLDSYQQSKTCLLVVDDAQNLSVQSLELIRLLCNLETDQEKLLQILLVGQPELEQALAAPELRQLKSRIVKHARLRGLHKDELSRYFDFRVNAAGGAGRLTLQPAAADVLHKVTSGNLRQLHLVLDRCLYGLAGSRQSVVDVDLVRRAMADVPSLSADAVVAPPRSTGAARAGRTWMLAGLAMGVATVAVAAWVVSDGSVRVPSFSTPVVVASGAEAATSQAVAEPSSPQSAPATVSDATASVPAVSSESTGAAQTSSSPPVMVGSTDVPTPLPEPEADTRAACERQLGGLPAEGQLIDFQRLSPELAPRIKPSSRVCLFGEAGQRWVAWVANGSVRHIVAAQQAVRSAQVALKNKGLLEGIAPDGLLGPRTAEALARFQQQHRLAPTGHLDEMTFFLLENADVATR